MQVQSEADVLVRGFWAPWVVCSLIDYFVALAASKHAWGGDILNGESDT